MISGGLNYETEAADSEFALSPFEADTIGEIMNISMGSAATAISSLLDRKVLITTPEVSTACISSIAYDGFEPAMCVEITYVEGISGSNVMVFKQADMAMILDVLMGREPTPPEEFEFDEIAISAACEVMNQMMGASATALSNFLGMPINISTPNAMLKEKIDITENMNLNPDDYATIIKFNLEIENVTSTEFISVMSMALTKEIIGRMTGSYEEPAINTPDTEMPVTMEMPDISATSVSGGGSSEVMSQDAIEQMLNSMNGSAAPAPEASGGSSEMMSQEAIEQMLNSMNGGGMASEPTMPQMPSMAEPMMQMPQMQNPMQMQQPMGMPQMQNPMQMQQPMGMPQMQNPMQMQQPMGIPQMQNPMQMQQLQMPMQPNYYGSATPMPVNAKNVVLEQLSSNGNLSGDSLSNLEMIMSVPMQVTVEIGRTQKKIKEILDFTQGTIVELDKQAGSPVDIIVNGQPVARGDVVVIDDNFAIRITEILKTKDLLDNL